MTATLAPPKTEIYAADDPRLSPQVRKIAEAMGSQALRVTRLEGDQVKIEPVR